MKQGIKNKKGLLIFMFFFIMCIALLYVGNYFFVQHGLGDEVDIIKLQENIFIYDEANCINENIESFSNGKLQGFSKSEKVDIFVVTVPTIHGSDSTAYAKAIKKTLALENDKRSILLFISQGTNEYIIIPGNALETIMDKTYINSIMNNYFSEGNDIDISYNVQQSLVQMMSDIQLNKTVIDDYGKIFASSNKDMLIFCGIAALLSTLFAWFLMRRGKHFQQILDEAKEQERVEYLEKMNELDKQDEMLKNKNDCIKKPSDNKEKSSYLFSPASLPSSFFPSSSDVDRQSFTSSWEPLIEKRKKGNEDEEDMDCVVEE